MINSRAKRWRISKVNRGGGEVEYLKKMRFYEIIIQVTVFLGIMEIKQWNAL